MTHKRDRRVGSLPRLPSRQLYGGVGLGASTNDGHFEDDDRNTRIRKKPVPTNTSSGLAPPARPRSRVNKRRTKFKMSTRDCHPRADRGIAIAIDISISRLRRRYETTNGSTDPKRRGEEITVNVVQQIRFRTGRWPQWVRLSCVFFLLPLGGRPAAIKVVHGIFSRQDTSDGSVWGSHRKWRCGKRRDSHTEQSSGE